MHNIGDVLFLVGNQQSFLVNEKIGKRAVEHKQDINQPNMRNIRQFFYDKAQKGRNSKPRNQNKQTD